MGSRADNVSLQHGRLTGKTGGQTSAGPIRAYRTQHSVRPAPAPTPKWLPVEASKVVMGKPVQKRLIVTDWLGHRSRHPRWARSRRTEITRKHQPRPEDRSTKGGRPDGTLFEMTGCPPTGLLEIYRSSEHRPGGSPLGRRPQSSCR